MVHTSRKLIIKTLKASMNYDGLDSSTPPISEFLLHRLDDKIFKKEFRIPWEMSVKLCGLVTSNPIFHNNSDNPQRPVEEKVMFTLKRLYCFGNGASFGMLGKFFRVAEGSIELYTDHCLMAIFGLKDKLLTWPNTEAHQQIQEQFEDFCFDGCVGVIDGKLVVLQGKTGMDGQDYYNRKGSYGIATLLICEKNKKIQYVYIRWPGCSHNQRLTTNCSLTLSPHKFFSQGQYFLADPAFLATINIVPAFKRTREKSLTEKQQDFNCHLSGKWVVIENCIGLLKNRFQSLKGLRLCLQNNKDMT
ncbi:hypothetical protein VP01_3124g1 [Puccinia sorghi]|uniref:DDE Tnp4 domain-containing protein n=1 Tax=Puccinia sorghi TaxID=27349 RepID=A0A0L6UZB9_9BASI|nr:hypothetical protein VP01_3124g1 [Puccinia sorghi]